MEAASSNPANISEQRHGPDDRRAPISLRIQAEITDNLCSVELLVSTTHMDLFQGVSQRHAPLSRSVANQYAPNFRISLRALHRGELSHCDRCADQCRPECVRSDTAPSMLVIIASVPVFAALYASSGDVVVLTECRMPVNCTACDDTAGSIAPSTLVTSSHQGFKYCEYAGNEGIR